MYDYSKKKNDGIYDAYLAHHGILGMHWGIRRYQNPDGTLTSVGRERYRMSQGQKNKIQRILDDSDAFTDVSDKVFKVAKADDKYLKQARDTIIKKGKEINDISKQTDELFKTVQDGSHHPDKAYYQAVSEIANYGYDSWRTHGDINNVTIRDMADGAWMGIFDDGQQSKINAISMYTYKHNLQDKVTHLANENARIGKEQREEAKKLVKTALDEVGGENLAAYKKNPDYPAYEAIVRRMINDKQFHKGSGSYEDSSYELNMALDASNFTEKEKKDIKAVESWASKLKNNGDDNTWYLLNEASENLGMNNKKASEMSQADWDKLNNEIRKLRESGRKFY